MVPLYDKIKSIKDILTMDGKKNVMTIDIRARNIEKEILKIDKE